MMKRAILVIMGFALLLCLCACATTEDSLTWQEQYDLGIRYLSEGNYEEAIIAFTAAIEIDPKQILAFVGRGDVYAVLAEQEPDNSVALTLWQKSVADYEYAFELGNTQVEERLEESREILRHFQAEKDAQPLLETLYTQFEDANIEGAKVLMRQADYQELSASVSKTPYHYDHGDGSGLAVYPDNFYYCGQWKDGLRSGRGIWIQAVFENGSDLESYIYEGLWADDRPNGEGHIVSNRHQDKIQLESGHTTSVKTEITGSFTDGLYHGTIYEVWNMNNGGIHVWSPITAVNGVYQPIQNVPNEIQSRAYYQERVASGEYIVALDQESASTDLWDGGSLHIVLGFKEIAE